MSAFDTYCLVFHQFIVDERWAEECPSYKPQPGIEEK